MRKGSDGLRKRATPQGRGYREWGGAPDSGKTPFVCFPAESVSVGAGFAPFFARSALDSSPSVHCRFLSVPYPRQRTPFVHSASSAFFVALVWRRKLKP